MKKKGGIKGRKSGGNDKEERCEGGRREWMWKGNKKVMKEGQKKYGGEGTMTKEGGRS